MARSATAERRFIGDVGDLVHGLAALPVDFIGKLAQGRLVSRVEHQARPSPGRHPRCAKADPA
jgi:hypothetical protein